MFCLTLLVKRLYLRLGRLTEVSRLRLYVSGFRMEAIKRLSGPGKLTRASKWNVNVNGILEGTDEIIMIAASHTEHANTSDRS